MNRLRLATWITLASLASATGCHSCGNGGLFHRMSARRGAVVCEGPVCATPVSSMPCGDGFCEGGPMLGDPYGYGHGMVMPSMPAANGGMPHMTMPPTTSMPPMTTLPPPATNTGPPPLAPVPGTAPPGLATPTPAQPSSRIR